MEKVKMTKKEQAVLDMLDQYIHKWKSWQDKPLPEIHLYKKDAKLFDSVCDKVRQGMPEGTINPEAKTYRDVPIRCQL